MERPEEKDQLARSNDRAAACGQHLSGTVWRKAGRPGEARAWRCGWTDAVRRQSRDTPPGSWSSQRHWHATEDEFVYVVEGELTLLTDTGEKVLKSGMAAGFPAGKADGHHLINRSSAPALYLEVGTRVENEEAQYSDIDMMARNEGGRFVFMHKNGEPYR